jgi:hypothetical protein
MMYAYGYWCSYVSYDFLPCHVAQLISPAFKNVVVSHKMNFSPEWLRKLEAILAATHPHHLSLAWSNWFSSC